MPHPSNESIAFVYVFIATGALAFKGVFAKFAYLADMSVDALLLVRFGIAAPLFWLGVVCLARRTAAITWPQWKACGFAGVMFFLATYCDFTALSKIPVSVSRLILFTFPVLVMLINAVLLRQPPGVRQWVVFAVTYLGIGLVVAPGGLAVVGDVDWIGGLWAVGSAFTYAVYLVASQEIMKRSGSVRFTAATGTVTLAAMLATVSLKAGSGVLTFPAKGVLWGAVIAVGCTVIPFFMLFEGIKRCGATQASLIALSGPIVTVLAAWLILGETLTTVQIAGAAITLLGVGSLKTHGLMDKLIKIRSLSDDGARRGDDRE